MKAKAINRSFSYDGKPIVTFEVKDKTFLDNELLDGREVDLNVKQFRQRRSLDANAYAWVLIGKLTEAITPSGVVKDEMEVYHQMLVRYGVRAEQDGKPIVFSMLYEIDLKKVNFDLYVHSMPIGMGEVNGKLFSHYRALKGSSQYDTKEMSVFIDGIIQDCKELGIETMTPDELLRLKGYEVNHTERA